MEADWMLAQAWLAPPSQVPQPTLGSNIHVSREPDYVGIFKSGSRLSCFKELVGFGEPD